MLYYQAESGHTGSRKIRRLMRRLQLSKRDAVGLMHLLWDYVSGHHESGDVSPMTPDDIADVCEFDGDPDELFAALVDAELVDASEHTKEIHNWHKRHERMFRERERAKASRERTRTVRVANADGTRSERVAYGREVEVEGKEEKKTTTTTPSAPGKPDAPPPDSFRALTDELVSMFTAAYGHAPNWAKGHYVRLREAVKGRTHSQVVAAFRGFLADKSDFYRGHKLAKFAGDIDRWSAAPTEAYRPAAEKTQADKARAELEAARKALTTWRKIRDTTPGNRDWKTMIPSLEKTIAELEREVGGAS